MNPVIFNRAAVTGREIEYVTKAITDGPIHGDGPFTRACHEWLERLTGSPRALLTTSCTHALEMTALLLDLQPGDEVIVPPFTFVSTVNAIALRGARPVFVDVRPNRRRRVGPARGVSFACHVPRRIPAARPFARRSAVHGR